VSTKRKSLVIVEWDDACMALDEEDVRDEVFAVRTVGWVIARSKCSLIVAAEILPDGRTRGVTRIPRACVLRVERLRA